LLGTTCGAADIVEWSRALHQRYLSDPSAIEPNLAAAVATVVARNGSDEDYEIFAGRCAAAATPQEALRYQRALGEFPAKRHMERTLAMCMGGAIRSQDAPLILAVALSNREQGITAWRFVKSNWEHINRTYSPIAIAPCLASVSFLDQPEVADDVVSFFRAHEVPQGRQMLQHLERLRVNVAFRQRERPRLAGALRM
jgi:aminopeptidase N